MTDTDFLAAEYALGLLDGEELARARDLEGRDPAFASAVAGWQAQLAPLLDEIGEKQAHAHLWQSIERRLGPRPANDNRAELAGQLRRWKWATAIMSGAAAAMLAALLALPFRASAPVQPDPLPPLAASIPVGDSGVRLEVTYLGQSRELVVAAAGLTADGVHDHELWLVPGEGAPLSLGVVEPGTIRKARLDDALAAQLADGGKLVLTREPLGGAPEGGKAGPVVAQGSFTAL
ncbi:anti-sigma factor [Parerythrobacter aurantius]|uniref:anti-sigma factor n=1 Tax=Parerythrobacter aurantius TaxID=3127706 RepID=UPI003254D4CC